MKNYLVKYWWHWPIVIIVFGCYVFSTAGCKIKRFFYWKLRHNFALLVHTRGQFHQHFLHTLFVHKWINFFKESDYKIFFIIYWTFEKDILFTQPYRPHFKFILDWVGFDPKTFFKYFVSDYFSCWFRESIYFSDNDAVEPNISISKLLRRSKSKNYLALILAPNSIIMTEIGA